MPVVEKGSHGKAICERCRKNYDKKVFWQKYCSNSCKVIAWGLKEANKVMRKTVVVIFSVLLSKSAFAETASWYSSADACGPKTNNQKGCPTASGRSIYALEKEGFLFAASNDFTLGTRLDVVNKETGKRVEVTVLDRGGFRKYGRTIDLGRLAFSKIADTKKGVIPVTIEKL